MVVRVRERTTARLRCAVCHGDGTPAELVECGECAARCHPDCLATNQGCPSLACPRSQPRPARPTPHASPVRRRLPQEELDLFELFSPESLAEGHRLVREIVIDLSRVLFAVGGRLFGLALCLTLLLAALTVLVQLLR